jgi:hypothetical protein
MNTGLLCFENFVWPRNFKKSFLYKVRLTIQGPPVPYLNFNLGREDPDPPSEPRDGIFGHRFNKKLESFAQCYSQCLLQADFRKTIGALLWV